MGIKSATGFTIIETMLFLAITGLLAVGILVGSGVAIGQQRYRDSVNSLKSYIQTQYSGVTNVANSRDKAWTCNASSDIAEVNPSAGQARGTSDCVLLGRFITVDASGTQVTAANVIGHRTAGAQEATSDIAELANYTMNVSPIDKETVAISWGARVVKPQSDTPMPLSMLIVRSPLSGSILTFTAEGDVGPKPLVAVANMNQVRNLCMNADIGSFVGNRMAVQIDAYATNQSAIQIPSESTNICD